MDEFSKENLLTKLRSDIEAKSGMRLKHRNDFVVFADLLLQETGQRLSDTTLRRFWGYQEDGKHTATTHTLDILCAYLGYKNWDEYESCNAMGIEPIEVPLEIEERTTTDELTVSKSRRKWFVTCMAGIVVMGGGYYFPFCRAVTSHKTGLSTA